VAHEGWRKLEPPVSMSTPRSCEGMGVWRKAAAGSNSLRASTIAVGRAQQTVKIFFQYFNYSKLGKYKSCTSYYQKNSKHCMLEDKFKRNNFPAGKELKFPIESELKIQEETNLKLV
jgi:hypothetical protein